MPILEVHLECATSGFGSKVFIDKAIHIPHSTSLLVACRSVLFEFIFIPEMNFALPKAKKVGKVISSSSSQVFTQKDDDNNEKEGKEACQRLIDKGAELAEVGSFEEAAQMFLTAVDYDPTNSLAFEMCSFRSILR